MRRYTLSRLNDEIDAMFPMLKKADWRSVRKKREMRASASTSDRNGGEDKAAGTIAAPFVCLEDVFVGFVNI